MAPVSRCAIALLLALMAVGLSSTTRPLAAQHALPTPDGHPDLQGIWLNNTATPLERPKQFAETPLFTEEEAHVVRKALPDGSGDRDQY